MNINWINDATISRAALLFYCIALWDCELCDQDVSAAEHDCGSIWNIDRMHIERESLMHHRDRQQNNSFVRHNVNTLLRRVACNAHVRTSALRAKKWENYTQLESRARRQRNMSKKRTWNIKLYTPPAAERLNDIKAIWKREIFFVCVKECIHSADFPEKFISHYTSTLCNLLL